jgi:peptide deformylase
MKRPLIYVPHDVLTTPAKTIVSFDKKLTKLVQDMSDTLAATHNPKGVGLAAVQIGEPWRVFVTRPKESDPVRVFVNPEIITQSDAQTDGVPERDNKLEGCLSIPRVWGHVTRAQSLLLKYQDINGKVHEESFKGFMATIIQHETDHINGILFTHRVLKQKGKLYQPVKNDKNEEALEEITLR